MRQGIIRQSPGADLCPLVEFAAADFLYSLHNIPEKTPSTTTTGRGQEPYSGHV